MKVNIIAEIGINHNGDIELAKKLIDVAVFSGVDYVKFQKRDPDTCVPEHMKAQPKSTPWGDMTYLEYKKRLEFSKEQYSEIDEYCKSKGIKWFFSVWDIPSAEFAKEIGHDIVKVPSALSNDTELLQYCRQNFKLLLVSLGMNNQKQIDCLLDDHSPDVVFHTNSSYPSPIDELNLAYIQWLLDREDGLIQVGYSGHEFGLVTTFAAIGFGASWIERHLTLDRSMWGSDQLASVEPIGFQKLVKGIRDIEKAHGRYGPRKITPAEEAKIKTLR